MNHDQEQSYYEIALTNRQVLVSFVVLLSCVLAAFVSGVWLGRKGSVPEPSVEEQMASVDPGATDLDQLEEFKLGSEQQEASELTEIVTEPRQGTTLAQDVGSSPPPRSSPPPPRSSPPPPRSSPPPPRSSPPPPPPPPPPPAANPLRRRHLLRRRRPGRPQRAKTVSSSRCFRPEMKRRPSGC